MGIGIKCNSFYRKWKEEKIKVKVWTRGIDKIRGFATGFIVAFDKHWTLALTDVDEHFNRHRSRKTYLTSGILVSFQGYFN